MDKHRWLNLLHAALLLAGMLALLAALGWLVAGPAGLLWLAGLGLAFSVFTPRLSPALILRLYRAQPLQPHDAPGLHRIVRELAQRAALPAVPVLYYLPSPLLNAFSVGHRDDAAITVSDGLLRTLSGREVLNVMAHEVAHIAGNDMWLMAMADSVSRLVSGFGLVGQFLLIVNLPLWVAGTPMPWLPIVLMLLAPTLSALLQLALSRNREFEADRNAAALTGDPHGLAQALERMELQQERTLANLLFPGRRNRQPSLLRTHPHSEDRIARLRELAANGDRHAPPEEAPLLHAAWPMATGRPRHRWHGLWY